MNIKNIIIYALISTTKFIRSFFSIKGKRQKDHFLIVSTTGLGDTLWATPAIKALRQSYPNAYISILTSPVGAAVLKQNPHINEILTLKKPYIFSLFSHFFKLKAQKIENILVFHTSQRIVLPFCFFLGASEIIGTRGINKGLDFILTTTLENLPLHETQRRINLVSCVRATTLDPSLEIFLSEEDEKEAMHFLNKHGVPSYLPLIGIHPGAKDIFKQWRPENFIETANLLIEHLGCQVIVSGNTSEKELVDHIVSRVKGGIALTGQLSLGGFAALVKRFSIMISNDTGPMHVAFATHTPTVALFTPTNPNLCGPYYPHGQVKVIAKQPTCRPCIRKRCREPFCLLQISPKEVCDAALKLFYNHQRKKT